MKDGKFMRRSSNIPSPAATIPQPLIIMRRKVSSSTLIFFGTSYTGLIIDSTFVFINSCKPILYLVNL